MLVSTNNIPSISEFEMLLSDMMRYLEIEVVNDPISFTKYSSSDIEQLAYGILSYCAKDTVFDNSIELISGQSFPDIIAHKYYGVEVKTTKANHWKSTGSSVAEGTRIDGIERIFMLFGKLCDPVQFACKPYEECLSGVVVTHSPRYSIDMCLNKGETFFDKINIPYDDLRKSQDPLKTVVDYYRAQLKPGQTTWWAGTGASKDSKMIVRLWSSVTEQEQQNIQSKAMCLFPEIFSNHSKTKFRNMYLWLASVEGVVATRDIFTAGGQEQVLYNDKVYAVPRIIYNLCSNIEDILSTLANISIEEINEYWSSNIDYSDILNVWIARIAENAALITDFPIAEYIEAKVYQ